MKLTDKEFYIEQDKDFGLGNFINCTPTIKRIYDYCGYKIPCYFNSDYVKECYTNSPYIEVIDSPKGVRLFGSELICRENNMPDYLYIQIQVLGSIDENTHTFIDDVEPLETNSGVFINGSGNEDISYTNLKAIDNDTMMYLKSKADLIGTGSKEDRKRNIFNGFYGDIRTSLALIKGAKFVISNDTGLYHAAAAMNKKQLVLWKDTKITKNLVPNKNCNYANKYEWKEKIDAFLLEYMD